MTFSQQILDWYSANKRDLPWREPGLDPYRIVVSEIMLQQTQVSRVIEKYHEFLSLFPTINDLAMASRAEVIHSWSGLGYNRRALMLHQFAQVVVQEYNGIIPAEPEELIKLPGIGPYTAGSIASFAFNKPEPAIDVNVRRIYHRFFDGKDQGAPGSKDEEKELHDLIKSTLPEHKSSELHNALMDFGSLVCLRENPRCGNCPLQPSCTFAPLYDTNKTRVMFVREKRKELGVQENGKHIPNRIFRGRIVEYVRKNSGEILINVFGEAVKKDYSRKDEQWLLGLCLKLQLDQMLDTKVQGKKITLHLAK